MKPNMGDKLLKLFFKKKHKGFIFFGHGVTKLEVSHPNFNNLHIDVDNLRQVISFWRGLGFTFISYKELEDIVINNSNTYGNWIHLTFDDGYKNMLDTALPLLEELNVPCTIYISAYNILEEQKFDTFLLDRYTESLSSDDYEVLIREIIKKDEVEKDDYFKTVVGYYKYLSPSEKEAFLKIINTTFNIPESVLNKEIEFENVLSVSNLKELAHSPMVTIGSHGYHHHIIATLDKEQMEFELAESKKILEEIIDAEVTTYCYPNGRADDYNEDAMNFCRQVGYHTAFTTKSAQWKKGTNLYSIPRYALSKKATKKTAVKLILDK